MAYNAILNCKLISKRTICSHYLILFYYIIIFFFFCILYILNQKLLKLLYYCRCINKYKLNYFNIILNQSECESNELLLDTLKIIDFTNECILMEDIIRVCSGF